MLEVCKLKKLRSNILKIGIIVSGIRLVIFLGFKREIILLGIKSSIFWGIRNRISILIYLEIINNPLGFYRIILLGL